MRVSVIVFPGTNCEHDVVHLYRKLLNAEVAEIWHRDRDLERPDVVVIPGGFSFGDYLRTGALAKVSPVMQEVSRFAASGGPVLGICNGFQVLCESGLLPGALMVNISQKFLSRFVNIRVEKNSTPFTGGYAKGEIITCPIAHFEGNYFAEAEILKQLEAQGQIVFRYCDSEGRVDENNRLINPNGSCRAIAGVSNRQGNVVGLMPHPERAVEGVVGDLGRDSGLPMFSAVCNL